MRILTTFYIHSNMVSDQDVPVRASWLSLYMILYPTWQLVSTLQTDVCILDFAKAFDKVGHRRLVEKLKWYGIDGAVNTWIKSFLNCRTQRVVVEGESSEELEVTSGVPQGSVLGPCLFLYYINDIAEGLSSTVRLFADDTMIYMAIRNDSESEALQKDLDLLCEWEAKWMMEFHPDKCEILTITRKKSLVMYTYRIRGQQLKHSEQG